MVVHLLVFTVLSSSSGSRLITVSVVEHHDHLPSQWDEYETLRGPLERRGYVIFKDSVLRVCKKATLNQKVLNENPYDEGYLHWFPYVDLHKAEASKAPDEDLHIFSTALWTHTKDQIFPLR